MGASNDETAVSNPSESDPCSRDSDRTKHYPYDCPKAHCLSVEEPCVSASCIAKLDLLRASSHASVGKLLEEDKNVRIEIEATRAEMQKRWQDAPSFAATPDLSTLNLAGICVHGPFCPGCSVELNTRGESSGRKDRAILEWKLRELKDYVLQRRYDEGRAK